MLKNFNNEFFTLLIENFNKIITDFPLKKAIFKDLEEKYPGFAQECNDYCVRCIYDYITKPLNKNISLSISYTALKEALNVVDQYDKFYSYLLTILAEHNLLSIKNDILNFKWLTFDISTQKKLLYLKDKYRIFKGTIGLLEHCLEAYPKIFSGELPGISVLYPNGNTNFLDDKLSEDTAEYSEMPIIKKLTAKLIADYSQTNHLKILEIGGGRGLITRELLSVVNKINIEYHFTDISRRFILNMEKYVNDKHLNFVKCFKYDITKSSAEQNILLNHYDLVIGLDVVHVAPDIDFALKNLQQLLNQNGILCLLETTKTQYWQNLIMGVTTGWWQFKDQLRSHSPLLSTKNWKKALKKSGFNLINLMTLENKNSDATIIFSK